jgi:hypothetical protein
MFKDIRIRNILRLCEHVGRGCNYCMGCGGA